jgi:RNA polymerase sigma-70 factor (ECF subfamily)
MGELELDSELVQRAKAGDKGAFDLLVRKYQHRIAAVVSRFVRDYAECQDVVQDSFIRAYKSLAGFRGDSQFYTWMYRIAVNTAKNHLASQKRRPSADVELEDAEHIDGGIYIQNNDTPEHELLREEIAQVVSKALDQLPAEIRQAITLREMEGLSYEEIAEVMNSPVGTVRSRIFRAREAIDVRLRPLYEQKRVRP